MKKGAKDQIEQSLDKIVCSEVRKRFTEVTPKDYETVYADISQKRQEIVEQHNRNLVANSLASFLRLNLELMPGGYLYFEDSQLAKEQFRDYSELRSKVRALLYSSVITLEDKSLADMFSNKTRLFEQEIKKGQMVKSLIETQNSIMKKLQKADKKSQDENELILGIKVVNNYQADLFEIDSQFTENQNDEYIGFLLEDLRQGLISAQDCINKKKEKYSEQLFANFQEIGKKYEETEVNIANLATFVELKNDASRYLKLFEGGKDQNRTKVIQEVIVSIDDTLTSIGLEINDNKKTKTDIFSQNEKTNREAVEYFADIKNSYEQGLTTNRNVTLPRLNAYMNLLKASNQHEQEEQINEFLTNTNYLEPPSSHHKHGFGRKLAFAIVSIGIAAGAYTYHDLIADVFHHKSTITNLQISYQKPKNDHDMATSDIVVRNLPDRKMDFLLSRENQKGNSSAQLVNSEVVVPKEALTEKSQVLPIHTSTPLRTYTFTPTNTPLPTKKPTPNLITYPQNLIQEAAEAIDVINNLDSTSFYDMARAEDSFESVIDKFRKNKPRTGKDKEYYSKLCNEYNKYTIFLKVKAKKRKTELDERVNQLTSMINQKTTSRELTSALSRRYQDELKELNEEYKVVNPYLEVKLK